MIVLRLNNQQKHQICWTLVTLYKVRGNHFNISCSSKHFHLPQWNLLAFSLPQCAHHISVLQYLKHNKLPCWRTTTHGCRRLFIIKITFTSWYDSCALCLHWKCKLALSFLLPTTRCRQKWPEQTWRFFCISNLSGWPYLEVFSKYVY